MSVIGIDIDDVTASLVENWLKLYKLRSKHDLKEEDLTDWDISKFVLPEFKEEIYRYIERPTIYNNAKPVEGALEAYSYLLSQGHDVLFITASTAGCAGRKYEWLIENGFEVPHNNYIECQRKELIDLDFLVDDKFENCRDTTGVGILFNKPWNEKYDWFPRARNWEDVIAIIEGRMLMI